MEAVAIPRKPRRRRLKPPPSEPTPRINPALYSPSLYNRVRRVLYEARHNRRDQAVLALLADGYPEKSISLLKLRDTVNEFGRVRTSIGVRKAGKKLPIGLYDISVRTMNILQRFLEERKNQIKRTLGTEGWMFRSGNANRYVRANKRIYRKEFPMRFQTVVEIKEKYGVLDLFNQTRPIATCRVCGHKHKCKREFEFWPALTARGNLPRVRRDHFQSGPGDPLQGKNLSDIECKKNADGSGREE